MQKISICIYNPYMPRVNLATQVLGNNSKCIFAFTYEKEKGCELLNEKNIIG
jgi:hypothetical protein